MLLDQLVEVEVVGEQDRYRLEAEDRSGELGPRLGELALAGLAGGCLALGDELRRSSRWPR